MSAEAVPIPVILNPAYGSAQPVTSQVDRIFSVHEKKWRINLAHRPGDALRYTLKAVQAGAEMVVCSGDDTLLLEIISGVYGSRVPIGFLPENEDSVIANRLGLPTETSQAIELLFKGGRSKNLTVGLINGSLFLFNLIVGISAEQRAAFADMQFPHGIDFTLKFLQYLDKDIQSHYVIGVEGNSIELNAVLGFVGLFSRLGDLHPKLAALDQGEDELGLLFVSRAPQSTLAYDCEIHDPTLGTLFAYHWAASEVSIEAQPSQSVWRDGEASGQTPINVKIAPESVRLITP